MGGSAGARHVTRAALWGVAALAAIAIVPEPEPDTGSVDPWQVTVRSLGIGVGYSGTLECPGGGRTGQVWGTGVYTDHSSICTAAVHFGLISAGAGGRVTFDVLGVQPEFVGSWSHGVSSGDHPSAGPAFQFSD